MTNLSNFTAELQSRNVSRPALYYVEILSPPIFENSTEEFSKSDKDLVSMWCHTAHTPQVTILTRDEYLEAGTRRKYAYDQDYQNLTLSFYLDQEYKIKKFFDQWKQAIVPQRRNFEYPDSYTADKLNLYIINQAGEKTYSYEYSRVFPKSINSVDLSYANGAQIASLTVDFVFEEVYYTAINDQGNPTATSKPKSTYKFNNGNTAYAPAPANREAATDINGGVDEMGNNWGT